jgi:hypothetical protein
MSDRGQKQNRAKSCQAAPGQHIAASDVLFSRASRCRPTYWLSNIHTKLTIIARYPGVSLMRQCATLPLVGHIHTAKPVSQTGKPFGNHVTYIRCGATYHSRLPQSEFLTHCCSIFCTRMLWHLRSVQMAAIKARSTAHVAGS